jgi:hypothetical protein
MVDDIGSPLSRFRLDVASSVVGAVAAAAVLGLLAWGVGVQLGLGDLDARTRALDAGLEQTRAVLRDAAALTQDNARQIAALSGEVRLLAAAVAELTKDSAEERRIAREDMRELRELTRQNSLAVRDLLNRREGVPAPPGP